MLVESPDPGAVLFANPKDAAIYYYQEGMAAAKGSFDNDRREALAVMVVNHGLREVAPGVYETTARLGRPGVYNVIFSLASPTLVHAFELKVAPDPALESQRHPLAEVHPPSEGKGFTVGQNAVLRFGVTRPGSKEPADGVNDVHILIRHTGSNWERHTAAQNLGNGVYGVEFLPPAAGNYRISFASESLRLPFQAAPSPTFRLNGLPETISNFLHASPWPLITLVWALSAPFVGTRCIGGAGGNEASFCRGFAGGSTPQPGWGRRAVAG